MDFLSFDFELSEPIGPTVSDEDRVDNVVAQFRLFVGVEILYRDVDFPVVELALALRDWLEHVEWSRATFSFDSRSSVLRGLFQIFPGVQGWHLTSIQQDLPSSSVFTLEQVETEVRRFIDAAEAAVFERFGFSLLSTHL